MTPYLSDEYHIPATARDKAMATHLRHIASHLTKTAKRFTEECDHVDSLCGSEVLHPFHIEDTAIQDAIVNYTRANWKRIGDISFAWGIIQLVRLGSQVYSTGEKK